MLKSHLKKTVFLLVIAFFLQTNLGVARAYCLHESAGAAKHIGHHEHQHTSSLHSGEASDEYDQTTTFHSDCASCVSALTLAIMMEPASAPVLSMTHANLPPSLKTSTPYLALPDRPQW